MRFLLFFLLATGGGLRAQATFFAERVAPIMEQHCVTCHGAEKKKAGLRVDTYENLMRGAKSGDVIQPGDPKGSELFRRIILPASDEDVMPSDGKTTLSKDEIKIIELWIAAGASATKLTAEFSTAPMPAPAKVAYVPLAPDWRPLAQQIAALEKEGGFRLVPRSQIATDGLILRTASAPGRCDDRALARIVPLASLIVEAELARTTITDAGLKALAACENLRAIDLTHTAVTSAGLSSLAALKKLEALNLTDTAVDDAGVAQMKSLPALRRLWLFGSKATAPNGPAKADSQ